MPQPATAEAPCPWISRPILVHIEDSYSVNCSAFSWIVSHLKARYLWLPDPWHMIHNVGLNSVKESGYFGSIALTSCAMDVSWGPWQTEEWFRTVQDGLAEWCSHTSGEADPLIAALLPRIAEERGWDCHLCSRSDVYNALTHCNFLKSKGAKSQVTRWWQWHKRFGRWIGEPDDVGDVDDVQALSDVNAEWSLRLVPLIYIGIQLGFIKVNGAGKPILKELATSAMMASDGSDGSLNMKSAKEQTQRVRENTKNNLHVATVACPVLSNIFQCFDCQFFFFFIQFSSCLAENVLLASP